MSTEKKAPEWLQSEHPALSQEQLAAAVSRQIVYPRVVRDMVDKPITNQCMSNISFMLFTEPKRLSTGKFVYGYAKSRGNWVTKEQATSEATKIIAEQDSKFQVRIAPTGHWVPITDEQAFCEDLMDVRMNEAEKHLRDKAVKEKEAESRKIQREIREREDEVKKGDIYDNPLSLEFYTMKRVTELRLTEAVENLKAKLDGTIESRKKQWYILRQLEKANPQYQEQWIDRYNDERRKGGISEYIPSETQFAEYESYKPEVVEDPIPRELRGYDLPEETKDEVIQIPEKK